MVERVLYFEAKKNNIKDDKVALKAKKLPTYLNEIKDKKGFFSKRASHFTPVTGYVYICLLLYSLGLKDSATRF
jgi:hypothetical protein